MRLAKSPLTFRSRLQIIQIGLLCLFVAVGLSYYRIQIVKHDYFKVLGERFRVKKRIIKASRGLIYDRSERLVTRNLPAYDLVLMRDEMKEKWDLLRPRLAEFLDEDETELDAIYSKSKTRLLSLPIVIQKDIPFTDVVRILRNRNQYSGINVDVSSRRDYVYDTMLSHVLGYVGEAAESDMATDSGLRMGDIVGKRGLEKSYNQFLTGQDGEKTVQMNSRGYFFSEAITSDPKPGANLYLTVDLDLQKIAIDALAGHNGTVLMMDVTTGGMLVFVSSPSFDLNRFTKRMTEEEWLDLSNQPDKPLFSRPLQGLYAPGSIFKIVTALAALDKGVITPETRFFCTGEFEYYDRVFKCHLASGHGELDLKGAIQKSCNVYFYQTADQMGATVLASMASRLGFGTSTGIDLIGEKSGVVPSPKWKKRLYNKIWFPGETLSMCIGQGDLQVTPVQILSLMAVVANKGSSPIPHLIQKIEYAGETQLIETGRRHVELSESEYRTIQEGMWNVVNREHGTGSAAKIANRDVCGKTGTAQLVTFRSDHDRKDARYMNAWFAGFAPLSKPEVAIVVLVEHGGGGGVNAAPVARLVLDAYFNRMASMAPI